MVRRTGATSALEWYVDLGIPARHAAPAAARSRTSCPTTRPARPTWSSCSRGAGGSWKGIANRTDFDLKAHTEASGSQARVLRPGHQRALLPLRHRAGGRRHPDHDGVPARRLRRGRDRRRARARCCACIRASRPIRWRFCRCPSKDTLIPTAREVLELLQPIAMCDYDETQSIGRRYRRQDEIGTPLCGHRRLRLPRGPGRDHPGSGHDRAGPGTDQWIGRGDPRPAGRLASIFGLRVLQGSR